jgi:NAD(P)-dependent dehydrogenase (short-subunit alcohol dehydrogenase family)
MTNWTKADIPSQEGRLRVVTGANSGVGWHTALELARAGSEVILAVRSAEKGRTAVEGIRRLVPDLASAPRFWIWLAFGRFARLRRAWQPSLASICS